MFNTKDFLDILLIKQIFIFSWEPALWTLNSQERVMMSKKNLIDIFNFKQRLLSIDMKTKVVEHAEREWMRQWKLWK